MLGKYIFRITCMLVLVLKGSQVFSQELPIYNQFYFNPFLYNPAFVAHQNVTEINTVFRQQWLGITDSPVNGAFTVQYAGKNNVSLGLTVTHESVVLQQKSSILLSYGYRLPLGNDHSLTFGISGGVGRYGLDLSQVDTSDPALQDAGSSTLYADGNFGFLYSLKGLNLSFALVNLFENNQYKQDNLSNLRLSNLESFMGSVSYKFMFPTIGLSLQPYLLYRSSGSSFEQIEAATVLYYQDKIWLGGAYRLESNPALFAGFNLLNNFKVGYSYEFAPVELTNISGGSHEFMLTYRFNKKKDETFPEVHEELPEYSGEVEENKKIEEEQQAVEAVKKAMVEEKAKLLADKENRRKDSIDAYFLKEAVVKEEKLNVKPTDTLLVSDDLIKSNAPEYVDGIKVMNTGYYVVAGVFSFRQNAEKFAHMMDDQGFKFEIGINPIKQYYYVYKLSTDDLEMALSTKKTYEKIKQFSDIWILKVD
jgi:type IX secretion system PorP/SprF family membrane protein